MWWLAGQLTREALRYTTAGDATKRHSALYSSQMMLHQSHVQVKQQMQPPAPPPPASLMTQQQQQEQRPRSNRQQHNNNHPPLRSAAHTCASEAALAASDQWIGS